MAFRATSVWDAENPPKFCRVLGLGLLVSALVWTAGLAVLFANLEPGSSSSFDEIACRIYTWRSPAEAVRDAGENHFTVFNPGWLGAAVLFALSGLVLHAHRIKLMLGYLVLGVAFSSLLLSLVTTVPLIGKAWAGVDDRPEVVMATENEVWYRVKYQSPVEFLSRWDYAVAEFVLAAGLFAVIAVRARERN